MFKTIVLATDLSPAWNEIVACAGEFKALGCEQVILTYVISVKFMAGMEGILQSTARPKLEAQQQQLEAQGLHVTVEIPMGLPADSLNEIACRYGADLIVVGSHGQSLLAGGGAGVLHLCGVAQCPIPRIASQCEITQARPAGFMSNLRHRGHFATCSLPTDFSEISSRALEYVERLAAKGICQVTVLNALDVPGGEEAYPPGYQEIAAGAARDLLEQWKQRLLKAGVPLVNDHFDPGHPLPAILQVLESQDISLIVMGTQGKGFIKEIFLGSVAHNVSRLATCPVLLIPPASR